MNFFEVVDRWTREAKDNFCSNCSFMYKNGLCPCRIEHMNQACDRYWKTGSFEA